MTEFPNKEFIRKVAVIQEKATPYRLKIESWALSRAKERGVNVPRVIKYYRDLNGREVLLLERIYGRHLFYRNSPENERCMFEVGRQMALLGNISKRCGWIDPLFLTGTNRSWALFLESYISIYGNRLTKIGIIEKILIRKLYKIARNADLDITNFYLLNRDIKPSNIIRGEDGKVWIVDWENAIIGDPLYDIAIFGVKYGHGILWESLKKGYGLNISSKRYVLYEIIALIGIINFYLQYQIQYEGRRRQLCRLIERLGNS